MIHEVTELVAAHLASSEHGVNAMLDGITLVSPDAEPSDIVVYHEYKDDWIAEDKAPPKSPSLTVFCVSDVDADARSGDGDARLVLATSVTVGVLYYAKQSPGANARRAAAYTLRAVRRSLLWLSSAPQAERTLRGVTIASFDRIVEQRPGKAAGEIAVTALQLARANVVDSDVR